MNVAFVTFGCRLNKAEALAAEAQAAAAGHTVVRLEDGAMPDEIVVRGCSVTAKAERDCRRAIAALRARHPAARIRLTGCLPDARNAAVNTTVPDNTAADAAQTATAPDSAAAVPMRTSRAYLKVQDGCGGRCAFCIVPTFRGPPRSVPFAHALARARAFRAAGYREIVVTGCNLALYRDGGRGLADLLAALAEEREDVPSAVAINCDPPMGATRAPLPAKHRVRIGSLEPGVCDDAVLAAMAAHPNICRFLHLSVQSGADAVLRRMGRPYSAATLDALCAAVRTQFGPDFALGADVITGFPGETDADFARTRAFLARHDIVNLHVFPYSERPGTPAATMPGAVPPPVRRARAKALAADARTRRAAFARRFVGRDVEVCVEAGGTGRTAEYLKCRLADASQTHRVAINCDPPMGGADSKEPMVAINCDPPGDGANPKRPMVAINCDPPGDGESANGPERRRLVCARVVGVADDVLTVRVRG